MTLEASISDIVLGVALELFIAIAFFGVIYKIWGRTLGLPQPNKILPFQRGVLVSGETVVRVLGPGTHWISPKRTAFLCDMRPKPFQVTGLELLTADQRWMRLSLKGETIIGEPEKYVTASGDSRGTFYVDIRQVLHRFVGRQSSHGFGVDNEELTVSLSVELSVAASAFGLTLTKLEIWETMSLGWHQLPIEPEPDITLIH